MKSGILVIGLLLLVNCVGCASLKEGARGFLGISTKVLEDHRKSAISRSFNYDYSTCYAKVLNILKKEEVKGEVRTRSYVYCQDVKKHLIALYVSTTDTTPVGIFFSEMDKDNTLLEVSSPSTYAKEVIAKKVFSGLEEPAVSRKAPAPPSP